MGKPSMSEYLLSSPETADLYQRATKSRFLELAGQGRLPRALLSQWLSQDRLYAQAYVRFIGGLISRVHLPIEVEEGGGSSSSSSSGENPHHLPGRILALLQACLSGITQELQLFESAAKAYGLDLAASGCPTALGATAPEPFGPATTTRHYIELFDSFGACAAARASARGDPAPTLLDGLVVLWATETVYLDAWTYARDQEPESGSDADADLDGGALRKVFIPNWTSDQFREFVREIRECLDAYAASQDEVTGEVGAAGAMTLYKRVLVLEEDFWPMVA
ncbi:hypothetical protein F4809DRAFT_322950 [Biscogniauxia mediterranea]|nr:hypothetical protein F4809DRAFT_322950 [Biscogniauxia mediterranea]